MRKLEGELKYRKSTSTHSRPVVGSVPNFCGVTIKEEPRSLEDFDNDSQSESSNFFSSQAIESDRSEGTSVRSSDRDSLGSHLNCYTLSDVTPDRSSLNSLIDPAWFPNSCDLGQDGEDVPVPRETNNPIAPLGHTPVIRTMAQESRRKARKQLRREKRIARINNLPSVPIDEAKVEANSILAPIITDVGPLDVSHLSSVNPVAKPALSLTSTDLPQAASIILTMPVSNSVGESVGEIPVPPDTPDAIFGLDEVAMASLAEEVRASIEDVDNWPRGLILLRNSMAEASFRQLLFTSISRSLNQEKKVLSSNLTPFSTPIVRHDILSRVSSLNYKLLLLRQNRDKFVFPGSGQH